MPNCAFCGAELPTNARFCSNCGQVPRAIAEQNPAMRVSPMQGIPQATPSTLSAIASSRTPPAVGNQPPPTNGVQTPLPLPLQPSGSFSRVPESQPRGRQPKWMGNVPLPWLIIGLIVIIVVASGLGILTAVARIHSTASSVSTPSTHTNPACSNPQSPNCKPQKNNKTPVASTSTVSLLFSGAVSGRLTSTRITSCGAAGSNYDINVQGKVSGTQYALVFKITAYKGAGTYNGGQMFSNLTQQPVSLTTTWVTVGNSPATATINNNIKSGTMAITVAGAINTVHISGNWTCA